MEERICQAHDLLHRLGVTANYKGYSYTAYALALCTEQPDMLLLVTKCLYPAVAKRYQTTWKAVERDIRTVIGVAWARNPLLLGQIADCPLEERPRCAQFLAMAAEDMRRGHAASLC